MTHIFICEEKNGEWKVEFGELSIHVESYEQAAKLSIMIGVHLGLIGY